MQINSKKYFVSGATGSFGKTFIKTILNLKDTKKVVLFSRDELKQSELRKELSKYEPKLRFLIGDVRDKERVKDGISDCNIVVHAAALKQVDTCEYNPIETIKTNINGTCNIAKASIEQGVQKCILVSTDKAVNPINLYGSSKLAAEKVIISSNRIRGKMPTRFSVVRYGNVSYSRGSVLNKYKELLNNKNDYLPVTDSRMTRFAIDLGYAVKFVKSCIDMMQGNEIFIPKIKAYRITDIVKALNKKVKIVGIRPGEKLNETLISKEELYHSKEFKNYFIISDKFKNDKLVKKFNQGYVSNLENNFLNINDIKKNILKNV